MAVAEEQLRLLITAEVQNAIKGLKDVQEGLGETGKKAEGLEALFEKLKTVISTGLVIGGLKSMVGEFMEAEDAGARLEGMIRATGGSAGMTAEAVNNLAQEIQRTTVYEADAVVEAQAMLMSFKNISGESFKETTKQALNLASALKMDAQSAVMLLGKALENPTEGIAALKRAKVSLSEASQAQITKLMEENKLHEAQAVILKEVEARFGGMAEAMAQTTAGKLAQAGNAIKDAFESVGGALAPAVAVVAGGIKGIVEVIGGIPGPILAGVAGMTLLTVAMPLLKDGIGMATKAMEQLNTIIKTGAVSAGAMNAAMTMGIGALIGVAVAVGGQIWGMIEKQHQYTEAVEKSKAKIAELTALEESGKATLQDKVALRQEELNLLDLQIKRNDEIMKGLKDNTEGLQGAMQAIFNNSTFNMAQNAKAELAKTQEILSKEKMVATVELRIKQLEDKANSVYAAAMEKSKAEAKAKNEEWVRNWWSTANAMMTNGLSEYEKKVAYVEAIKVKLEEAIKFKNGAEEGLAKALQVEEAALKDYVEKMTEATNPMRTYIEYKKQAQKAIADQEQKTKDLAIAQNELVNAEQSGDEKRIAEAKKVLELIEGQKEAVEDLRNSIVGSFGGMFGEIGAGFATLFSLSLDEQKLKEFKDKSDEFFKEWSSGLKGAFSAAGALAQEVFQAINDEETKALERSVKATEEKISASKENYNSQLEFLKSTGADTVDFEKRMKAEEKAMEEELSKKKAELNKKRFEQEKMAKLASIAMNTAQGVAGAFVGATPFTIALHAGLAALIGGMGAAQAAIVASQQVPEFYNGGILTGSAGGTLLRAGERNQPEAIIPLRKEKLRELGLGASGGISVVVNGADKSPREVALEVANEMEKLRREGVI